MIQVVRYISSSGVDYFGSWFEKQTLETRARIQARIDRVELGNFGDHRSVGGGVFELRVHWGSGYRVYYGRDGDLLVVLLAGGAKKRQAQDIERAIRNWNEYKQEKRSADSDP